MKKNTSSKVLTPYWCLFILTGMNFLNYFNRHFISAVLGPIKEDLSLLDGDLGRIATIFMLGYTLSSPVFGYLGDHFSVLSVRVYFLMSLNRKTAIKH